MWGLEEQDMDYGQQYGDWKNRTWIWTAMWGLEEQDMDYGQQCGDWKNKWIMDSNTRTGGWGGGRTGRTWIVDSNVGDDGLWPSIRRLEVCVFLFLFVPTRAVLKGLALEKFAFDLCVCMVYFTFVYRSILKLWFEKGFRYIYTHFPVPAIGRPDVTICDGRDVLIQSLTHSQSLMSTKKGGN